MVPLPPSVISIDDIVAEFRETLVGKIGELGKNFISTTSDKTIIFSNSSKLSCNGNDTEPGLPISSLQYNFKTIGLELTEKAIYTGCNSTISLVEDIVTRGTNLKPLNYSDFVRGKRDFDLKENETYRFYKLSNSDNEEIFKMLIQKTIKGKIVEMYIVGQKFISLNYEFEENQTRLTITYSGYKGRYVRKYSTWEFDNQYDSFNNVVLVNKNKVNNTFFFDTRGSRLSQGEFLERVDRFLLNGPISRIRNFLEYHNYYFPQTKAVQSGGQNEHLKEELRIALNRLQNNTELNLVKKQIQEYIDAAENGFLSDSRPKE
jgi:hypothetical protein